MEYTNSRYIRKKNVERSKSNNDTDNDNLIMCSVENEFPLKSGQRFTPEDMHKELIEESVHNAQFSHDEIPKVETIHNWVF
ncbi:323_t:CDS:2 [Entrophospora sp. SA101]|nr:323_t:CDS:2 [Entrophospora sp. SA101]